MLWGDRVKSSVLLTSLHMQLSEDFAAARASLSASTRNKWGHVCLCNMSHFTEHFPFSTLLHKSEHDTSLTIRRNTKTGSAVI